MGRTETLAVHLWAFGWHAARLYRLSRRLWLSGHHTSALIVASLNRVLTGVEIAPQTDIGPGLVILHGSGLVIHHTARVGRNCTFHQGVALGAGGRDHEPPVLGDNVTVFAGAKIIGPVKIGDGAVIGANAVVLCDVPADATAVGVPARVIG